jgi:hypothetical protein
MIKKLLVDSDYTSPSGPANSARRGRHDMIFITIFKNNLYFLIKFSELKLNLGKINI